ncbi:RDD family protein [Carnobacterium sp. TMP28]|uniref:RDD family protein n=1 Tax=Carnobacterium sp. TMP28 TaxID=3397060 RepID=UPI0039DFC8D7
MVTKKELTEKGETKELDLSELKRLLIEEETNLQHEKHLIQHEKEINENSDYLDSGEKVVEQEKHEKTKTPEELREERRLYWKEQNRQKQVEKTPFNYYPPFFYGGFWLRFFAYLIDLIIVSSLNRLIIYPFFGLTQTSMSTDYVSLYSLSKLTVFLLYFILMTKLTNGQTIGKMIFGLRVVCFKEERLSWMTVIIREGFGRYILKTISFLYLSVLFTKRKQHIVDLFTDTSVVLENTLHVKDWYKSENFIHI